ncbi:hypothetical protein Ddye_013503 [Dipteronia dyeriana]|uniref:RNase H type-1 domain-containing protein n=1 Tax=Dipteronia dyeriana TaxID=168575 RepID=A0AAD9X6J5_9ROSI|nr:hypothetical protein Ddye_013503 [Dipteronia dyeriana]
MATVMFALSAMRQLFIHYGGVQNLRKSGLTAVLWGLWWDNNLYFKEFFSSCSQSLENDDLALLGFKATNAQGAILGESPPSEVIKWQVRAEGMYKFNTDASIKASDSCEGVCIIIRDHCGVVKTSSDQRIEACYSLQITKTVAILRGIELVRDLGLVPTVVESDALGVVKLINMRASVTSDVGPVLNDISNIIQGANIVSVLFTSKKSNMVAYSFLRMTLNVVNDCFWVEDHPPFVGNLIRQDLLV